MISKFCKFEAESLLCTVWINCSSDLKILQISRPSASNFKSFSRSLEHFFLKVGQNNFGNKIPFFVKVYVLWTFNICVFWSPKVVTCVICVSEKRSHAWLNGSGKKCQWKVWKSEAALLRIKSRIRLVFLVVGNHTIFSWNFVPFKPQQRGFIKSLKNHVPYARHYNLLLIWNRSQLLTVDFRPKNWRISLFST